MKQTNNKGIPAVLMHTVKGVQYRINGSIVAINESNKTCSMKFNGYDVQDNIPISKVYLNEGILDKFKEVGGKIRDFGENVINGIQKLVKAFGGFILPVIDGNVDKSAINAPINVAIMAQKGMINGLTVCPTQTIIDQAADYGVDLEYVDVADVAAENETPMIEAYWSRVMKTYAANESFTLRKAIKAVNEKYYKVDKTFKTLNESHRFLKSARGRNRASMLNEANISLKSPINDDGSTTQYGDNINAGELKARLNANIREQLSGSCMRHSGAKPYLVFGAPGIGKTSIIKQLFNELRQAKSDYKKMQRDWIKNPELRKNVGIVDKGLDLMLEYQICASLQPDDFVIPGFEDFKVGDTDRRNAKAITKEWFPVFTPVSDDANDQRNIDLDEFYNSGLNKNGRTGTADGGIIFFDEFLRMNSKVSNIAMNLINDHIYEGMYLASRWGFVLASNRATEMNKEEGDFDGPDATVQEDAKKTRYIAVNFVPTREEWLDWAKRKNSRTGRANVDKMFTDFIETMHDRDWYDAIDFGSRNNVKLKSLKVKDIEATVSSDEYRQAQNSRTWNPRVWEENINNGVWDEVRFNLLKEQPDNFDRWYLKFVKNLIDETTGEVNPNKIDRIDTKQWYRFVNDDANIAVWDEIENLPVSASTPEDKAKYIATWYNWYCEYAKNSSDLFSVIFDEDGNVHTGKLAQVLDEIPEDDWNSWIDKYIPGMMKLGNSSTNGDNYKDQKRMIENEDRLHVFLMWIQYYMQTIVGKESVVSHDWINYSSYMRTFNTANIRSIWDTGHMMGEYEKDDELSFTVRKEYATGTQYAKWKENMILSKAATNLLFDGYPWGEGELNKQMANAEKVIDEMAEMNSKFTPNKAKCNYLMDDDEYDELFEKYAEHFAATVFDKKVYFLFTPMATKSSRYVHMTAAEASTPKQRELRQIQMNIMYMMEHSKFALQFANAAFYVARTDMQCGGMTNSARLNQKITYTWLAALYKPYTQSMAELTMPNGKIGDYTQYTTKDDMAASFQLITFPALCVNSNIKNLSIKSK